MEPTSNVESAIRADGGHERHIAPWLLRAMRDSAELRTVLPSRRAEAISRIAARNGSSPTTVRTYSAIARRYERMAERDPSFAQACAGMPIPLLKKITSIHERSPSAARRITDDWRAGIVNSSTPYVGSSRGDRRSRERIEDLEYRLEEAQILARAARGPAREPSSEPDSPLRLARAIRTAEAREAEANAARRICEKVLEDNAALRKENASLRAAAKAASQKSARAAARLRSAYKGGMAASGGGSPGERLASLLSTISGILSENLE